MADRKLYSADAAAKAKISDSTWRAYCAEGPTRRRQAPPADGTDVERGHARPWWWESTIDQWLANRPGRGARTDRRPPAHPTSAADPNRAGTR